MGKQIVIEVLDGVELTLSTVPEVWVNQDHPYPNVSFRMLDSNTGGIATFIGYLSLNDDYNNTWDVDWDFVFEQAHRTAAMELMLIDEEGRSLVPHDTKRWEQVGGSSGVFKKVDSYDRTHLFSVLRKVPDMFGVNWRNSLGGTQMTIKDNGLLLDYRDGEMDTAESIGTIVVNVEQTKGDVVNSFTKLVRPIWIYSANTKVFDQHNYETEGPYSPDTLIDAILVDMKEWVDDCAKRGTSTKVEFFLGGIRSTERYPHRSVTIEEE